MVHNCIHTFGVLAIKFSRDNVFNQINQNQMSKNHYEMSQVASAQIEIDYLRDEVAKLKEQLKDEKIARALLRKKGYFVENLWHIDDVKQNWNCSDEVAMDILEDALLNEATMEQIFLAIDDVADEKEIKSK